MPSVLRRSHKQVITALLIAGGIGKTLNLGDFKKVIYAYDVLPRFMVPLFSYTLPILELVTGIALVLQFLTPVTELTAAAIFLTFVFAISINLLRGRNEVSCGCFAGRADNISWNLVGRNLALASFSLLSTGQLLWAPAGLLVLSVFTSIVHTTSRSRSRPIAKQQ